MDKCPQLLFVVRCMDQMTLPRAAIPIIAPLNASIIRSTLRSAKLQYTGGSQSPNSELPVVDK